MVKPREKRLRLLEFRAAEPTSALSTHPGDVARWDVIVNGKVLGTEAVKTGGLQVSSRVLGEYYAGVY